MKRFVSRITLVALVAATCTPAATYSLHPNAKSGLMFAAFGAALTTAGAAGLWYVGQRKAQYNADLAEYDAINRTLPVSEQAALLQPLNQYNGYQCFCVLALLWGGIATYGGLLNYFSPIYR